MSYWWRWLSCSCILRRHYYYVKVNLSYYLYILAVETLMIFIYILDVRTPSSTAKEYIYIYGTIPLLLLRMLCPCYNPPTQKALSWDSMKKKKRKLQAWSSLSTHVSTVPRVMFVNTLWLQLSPFPNYGVFIFMGLIYICRSIPTSWEQPLRFLGSSSNTSSCIRVCCTCLIPSGAMTACRLEF